MPVVGFTPEDAKRIAATVKRVERMPLARQTQRRRHVVAANAPPTLALATVTVNACDLTGSLLSATMPECEGDVYIASGTEWAILQSQATIRNPTPFRYSSALCWLRLSGNVWLIERAADWQPHAYFGTALLTGTTGATPTVFSDLTQQDLGTFGYIASNVSGDPKQIQIDCPVTQRPFRVSYAGSITPSVGGNATGIDIRFGPTHAGGSFRVFSVVSKGTATAGGNPVYYTSGGPDAYKFQCAGSYVLHLSQGDILKLASEVTVTGGTLGLQTIEQAWIAIEPLF